MAMDLAIPGKRAKGPRRASPEMNVTPLVDVVLVLLIILMIVMPAMHRSFRVRVPTVTPEDAPPQAEGPIVLSVTEQGALRINRELVPDAELSARLSRMLVARGERRVHFDAHDRAPFERAVRAMDLAREAGATHIAVATERLE
jgi:biopolymer transport protein ExbD